MSWNTRLSRSLATALALAIAPLAQAQSFTSPDILVLGDSQITFGSGEPLLEFMSELQANCGTRARDRDLLQQLGQMSVGVIGVRSTSIHSWVAKGGAAKDSICEVDKKWKVNAGSYGVLNTSENIYVQIGQGANYQFCTPGQSAFQAMLRPDYYAPKLLFMAFLGNSSKRWANDPGLAATDVKQMVDNLPPDLPCVFMTTAPGYTKTITDRRVKAQEAVKAAFAKTGGRCSFVEGLTSATIEANLGNARHFRRHSSGKVKDPFHPNKRAARRMLELQRTQICSAVLTELRKVKGMN